MPPKKVPVVAPVAAKNAKSSKTASKPVAGSKSIPKEVPASKAATKKTPTGKSKSSKATEQPPPPLPAKGKKGKAAPAPVKQATVAVKLRPKRAPPKIQLSSDDEDENIPPNAKRPSFEAMILAAVQNLDDKKGSSIQAIKKNITNTFSVEFTTQNSVFLKKGLDSALDKGILVRVTGTGLNGSFKLPSKRKPKRSPTPPVIDEKKTARVRVDTVMNMKAKSKPAEKPIVKPKAVSKPKATPVEQVLKSLNDLRLEEKNSSSEESNDSEPEDLEEEEEDAVPVDQTPKDIEPSEDDSFSEDEESEDEEGWRNLIEQEVQKENTLLQNITKLSDIPEGSYQSSSNVSIDETVATDQEEYEDTDVVDESHAGDTDIDSSIQEVSHHPVHVEHEFLDIAETELESYIQDLNINDSNADDSEVDLSHVMVNTIDNNLEQVIDNSQQEFESSNLNEASYVEYEDDEERLIEGHLDEREGEESGEDANDDEEMEEEGSASEESDEDGSEDEESEEDGSEDEESEEDESEEEEEKYEKNIIVTKVEKLIIDNININKNSSRLSDSGDSDQEDQNATSQGHEVDQSEYEGDETADNVSEAGHFELTDDEDIVDASENDASYDDRSKVDIIPESDVTGNDQSTDYDDGELEDTGSDNGSGSDQSDDE